MVFVVLFLACAIAGEALQPPTSDISSVLSDLRWQSEQEKVLRSEIQYAARRLAAGGSQARKLQRGQMVVTGWSVRLSVLPLG